MRVVSSGPPPRLNQNDRLETYHIELAPYVRRFTNKEPWNIGFSGSQVRSGLGDCGKYGECSSGVALLYSASRSTPGRQNRALQSCWPLLALPKRRSSINRSSSAPSR